MSIVNAVQSETEERRVLPSELTSALLDVVVLDPRDVEGADEGGADRLYVVGDIDSGGLSPEPAVVSGVCKESDIEVRAVLRLNAGLTTTGGELSRLIGLGEDYLSMGAAGLVFGFLDEDTEVDVEVCGYLADRFRQVPWTFHRAIDSALSTDRAWRQLRHLPGLDSVLSAGSARGLEAGHVELTERAISDPDVAQLLMAGGGLRAEHVPWLVRAGVRQFHVGSTVRPGGSWKAYVDGGHVRSWRMLLDDALDRAMGRQPG
jgi:copper homeostasis protein